MERRAEQRSRRTKELSQPSARAMGTDRAESSRERTTPPHAYRSSASTPLLESGVEADPSSVAAVRVQGIGARDSTRLRSLLRVLPLRDYTASYCSELEVCPHARLVRGLHMRALPIYVHQDVVNLKAFERLVQANTCNITERRALRITSRRRENINKRPQSNFELVDRLRVSSRRTTPHHRRVHRQNCAQAESDSGSADGFSCARCSRGIASRRRSTSFFAERYSIRSRASVTPPHESLWHGICAPVLASHALHTLVRASREPNAEEAKKKRRERDFSFTWRTGMRRVISRDVRKLITASHKLLQLARTYIRVASQLHGFPYIGASSSEILLLDMEI
ncbi:unnamed protein product [Trichogramma brassicae]|uniref:Uncharacterized protein n=1 Tax=Trichogramma brassicae TaxID=86971 RepID=A0A6H5I7S7_9HYME|nr:unnamed protein product [Trichogramma brassicae]